MMIFYSVRMTAGNVLMTVKRTVVVTEYTRQVDKDGDYEIQDPDVGEQVSRCKDFVLNHWFGYTVLTMKTETKFCRTTDMQILIRVSCGYI